jgi:soluble P-type ATPase
MPIPQPNNSESEKDFIQRCMLNNVMVNEYEIEQRFAVCQDAFKTKLAGEKISFDFDGTLTTKKGFQKAKQLINEGAEVYIISARQNKDGMLLKANELGIPVGKVYATGSNEAKISKVKELGITTHYDNNIEVVKELGNIGKSI